MSDLSSLAQSHVAQLHAYTPGLQPVGSGWTKLNTNECPYPPSPRVAEAVRAELGADGASLRLYPDPKSGALRRAIARHHEVGEEQVLVGNGSDDVLNLLMRAFAGPQAPVGFMIPSYSLYPVLAAMQDAPSRVLEFDRSLRLPVEAMANSDAQIFFLTSPNAPTGVGFNNTEIEAFLATFPGLLVVDEAYAPFAGENAVPLLARYDRLVITRTLSKALALAGLRVGYALAHPEIIGLLDRVRDSYNVSRLAQAAALGALGDPGYYAKVIARVAHTRDAFAAVCVARGWWTYPSQANFVFTEPRDAAGATGGAVARALYEFLLSRQILVRHFPGHALTAPFLRISVGTETEMATVNQAFTAWQTTAPQP